MAALVQDGLVEHSVHLEMVSKRMGFSIIVYFSFKSYTFGNGFVDSWSFSLDSTAT